MIERRYPIQTVLAERKMFAGGGAVLPQQMMPQQQQSGGILASSGPLLDAVAAGAINPDGDGGGSLSEVQGFSNGGLNRYQTNPDGTYTRIVPEQIAQPQSVAEMMAAMENSRLASETGLDTSNAEERPFQVKNIISDYINPSNEGQPSAEYTPSQKGRAARRAAISQLRRSMGQNTPLGPLDPTALQPEYSLPDTQDDAMVKEYYDSLENQRTSEGRRLSELEVGPDDGPYPEGALNEEGLIDERFPSEDPAATTAANVRVFPEGALNEEGLIDERFPSDTTTPGTGEEPSTISDADARAELAKIDPFAAAEYEGEDLGAESTSELTSLVNLLTSGLESASKAKDPKRGMKDFLGEFKAAMPAYEGMSDSEKGFAIMEAGLKIMAGKSPDALTNIAEGLKGLGPQFAKDAKEKRAWNRQVELSAAKYGLENVARESAELRADAKADRQIFGKVFRVKKGQTFERNGEVLPEKSTVILTQGEIRDVDLSNLETEASIAAGIKEYNKRLKNQLELIQGSETDPNKFEGAKKTYLKDSAQVRTNTAVTGYLKNALVALNTKDVTGFRGLGKDVINKIANATGMKEYSEAAFGKLKTKAEYIRFTEGATTKFIEGLISEGGKISDFERNLARELSGAIGTRLFDGVVADTSILTGKIKSFISDLNSNTDLSLRSMALSEKIWSTRYNTSDLALRKQLGSYGQMLRESRRPLSGGRTGIAKGTLNWKDIINVDANGKTLGLKQNYRSGK